jgi:hypothetical protein
MSQYQTLKVEIDGRIAWVTFDHPPINLLDMQMIREIDQLSKELEANTSIHAAVFQSADPDFFIAHADVDPTDGSAKRRIPEWPSPTALTIRAISTMISCRSRLGIDDSKAAIPASNHACDIAWKRFLCSFGSSLARKARSSRHFVESPSRTVWALSTGEENMIDIASTRISCWQAGPTNPPM